MEEPRHEQLHEWYIGIELEIILAPPMRSASFCLAALLDRLYLMQRSTHERTSTTLGPAQLR
jgi:hypothetical protein